MGVSHMQEETKTCHPTIIMIFFIPDFVFFMLSLSAALFLCMPILCVITLIWSK